MIISSLTFLIIFAVIGAILYGQRLIKTEKSDAVFGNPERSKVVSTGLLLEVVFYYFYGFIIHGILQKLFIQNLQMKSVK